MPESPELTEFKTSVSIVIVLVNVYVILLSPIVSHCRQRDSPRSSLDSLGLGTTHKNNVILLLEVEVPRTTR